MQISPGMTHLPSRLCLSDLRRSVPYKFRALMIWDISPRYVASYPLPVRQTSALPSASFRFAVAHDTLAVRLTLPLVGRVEDFHLQVSAPCRAHPRKGAHVSPFRFCRLLGAPSYSWRSETAEPRCTSGKTGSCTPRVLCTSFGRLPTGLLE